MTRRVTDRVRADVRLCEQGLAATRAKAQELIRAGRVRAGDDLVKKAGQLVEPDLELTVAEGTDFVSRGGTKLDGALDVLGVSVEGAVVADIGASTGGFTDCVLRRGARKVYAVDVGKDQLAPALRADARVVVRDGVNARALTAADFDEPLDVVLVDASFIAMDRLAPALAAVVGARGELVALVKPQFEAGRAAARRGKGVIRDPEERARAIDGARSALETAGFQILAECDSRLPGPKGNVERFVRARLRPVRTP